MRRGWRGGERGKGRIGEVEGGDGVEGRVEGSRGGDGGGREEMGVGGEEMRWRGGDGVEGRVEGWEGRRWGGGEEMGWRGGDGGGGEGCRLPPPVSRLPDRGRGRVRTVRVPTTATSRTSRSGDTHDRRVTDAADRERRPIEISR